MTLILVSLFATLVVFRFSSQRLRRTNLFLLGTVFFSLLSSTGCTNAAQVISSIITAVTGLIPIVAAAGDLILPAEAAAVNEGAALVQSGLKALTGLINGYHANPNDTTLQKVTAAFTSVQSNLAQLESAAQVKDPVLQRKIQGTVDAATASLAVIEATINANHPTTVTATQNPQ